MSERETKLCAFCARTIEWRKKWERCWDKVRYCSDACRRDVKNKALGECEAVLRETLEQMLAERGRTKTLCPSEVARACHDGDDDGWRALMEPVRRVARRLVAEGKAVILQKGRIVEPSTARGAIRLRKA